MRLPPDFNRARADFLEAMVAELNLPLFKLVHEYDRQCGVQARRRGHFRTQPMPA